MEVFGSILGLFGLIGALSLHLFLTPSLSLGRHLLRTITDDPRIPAVGLLMIGQAREFQAAAAPLAPLAAATARAVVSPFVH